MCVGTNFWCWQIDSCQHQNKGKTFNMQKHPRSVGQMWLCGIHTCAICVAEHMAKKLAGSLYNKGNHVYHWKK